MGYPTTIIPRMGYSPPPSNLGWSTPSHQTWDGVPPIHQTWDGVPPTIRPGMGYPLPSRPGTGYPPPMVNRQTFPSINITFPLTTYAGGKDDPYGGVTKMACAMQRLATKTKHHTVWNNLQLERGHTARTGKSNSNKSEGIKRF